MTWTYRPPTGPTLDITKKSTGVTPFPLIEDERTDAEIMQDQFDKWQQQYEYEREHEKDSIG